jgi:hypothetical protein
MGYVGRVSAGVCTALHRLAPHVGHLLFLSSASRHACSMHYNHATLAHAIPTAPYTHGSFTVAHTHAQHTTHAYLHQTHTPVHVLSSSGYQEQCHGHPPIAREKPDVKSAAEGRGGVAKRDATVLQIHRQERKIARALIREELGTAR